MQYTKITIPIQDTVIQEILIAYLAEFDFDSFDSDDTNVYAYIPSINYNSNDVTSCLEKINQVELKFEESIIEQKNWNEEWEKIFEPVLINNQLSIRAPFHAPQNTTIELIIEPKMSFGTGHHATTFMMCEIMLQIDFLDKKVLDFGSGTGILAILASKLSAKSVLGIDNEEWAIENSIENAQKNACSNTQFKLGEEQLIVETYDIVLANINRHIILDNINVITSAVKNEGILLISGILNSDEEEMSQELNKYNFIHQYTLQKDGWSAMYFYKN
ncbi:MAG: 50S ribosomal protein L11 methyltransferase [Bacteroidota bacterium]